MNTELPECFVGLLVNVAEEPVADFVAELREGGIDVRFERQDSDAEAYAGLEWLLPTAIVIFFADKYFGTLIEEEAKAHYPVIRKAMIRLVRRVLGRGVPPVVVQVATPPTKIKEQGIGVLSVYSRLADGRTLKFVFEEARDPEAAVDALQPFLASLHSGVGTALPQVRQIVFRYAPEIGSWIIVYPEGG